MAHIRSATTADAGRMQEIYAHYVRHTAISFEWEVPSADEFRRRVETTLQRWPWLVIETDGAVRGYAYAGPHRTRASYGWCCEISIYLDPSARRQGLGRALYRALEDELKAMGILNLYAGVACPEREDEFLDNNSLEFHTHLGFAQVGRLHRCGRKFGRWYDLAWMEKHIGPHAADQPPVIPWPQVSQRRLGGDAHD